MAKLTASLVGDDEEFRTRIGAQLRSGSVGVRLVEDRGSREGHPVTADVIVADIRGDAAAATGTLERIRGGVSSATVFAVADAMDQERILQAMRAGANEFFAWPPPDEAFHEAIRRAAARRDASSEGHARSTTLVFLGAKGGAGTTTLAVNSASEIARVSKRPTLIIDLQPFVGEVALFLGVRPRFTLIDALDNMHRLDGTFLRELVARHKAGLDILAAADQVDRPGEQDASSLERLLQVLGEHYEYIVIDAGRVTGACAEVAVFAADTVYVVANPDVPSIRNTQRVIDRMGQLGVSRERVRVLLNRTSDQHLIAPKQIETALGHGIHQTFSSDYGTVAAALNSGVPLTQTNHSELAGQFNRFTREMLNLPAQADAADGDRRRGIFLGLF